MSYDDLNLIQPYAPLFQLGSTLHLPPLPFMLYPRYRIILQFSVVVVIVESFVVDRLDDFIPCGFMVEMDMNNLFIFQFPRKLDAV